MIPILYERNETTFASNGITRLSDMIEAKITEERNGIYEMEFTYPVDGVHYADITDGRIVAAVHDDNGDIQPFDIYHRTEPINGIVTFYAHHISYRLNENVVAPYTATNANDAMAGLAANAMLTNPFTFATDKTTARDFSVTIPTGIRAVLGGVEGSILDTFGGEYEFDKFTVNLWNRRGTDTDVQIRYGSNLTEYEDDLDHDNVYNAVVPYWVGTDDDTNEEAVVTGSVINSGESIYSGRTAAVPMDLSGEFETKPTAAQLDTMAASKLTASAPWVPAENLTINFVPLWQTAEYSQYSAVQRLGLCDTATIYFSKYNKSARMKIVRVVYNVLLERFDEIEFGELSTTLASAVTASIAEKVDKQTNEIGAVGRIAGNTAQHFWFNGNGVDTGAHITEVDRETFEADRANGGPNLLARTNGIAVRSGTTELATFSATSAVIGPLGSSHIVTSTAGVELFDDNGTSIAEFGAESRLGAASGPHIVQSVHTIGGTDYGHLDFISGSDPVLDIMAASGATKLARAQLDTGSYSSQIDLSNYDRVGDNINTTDLSVYLQNDNGTETVRVDLASHLGALTSSRKCLVLWTGTSLMQNGQTAYFTGDAELVSDQLNGIVLVWSRWANSTAYNDSWFYCFVPKWHTLAHNGGGVYMTTPTSATSATLCHKYIYVYDDHLEGYAGNVSTGTGYANNTRVLRAVLGI